MNLAEIRKKAQKDKETEKTAAVPMRVAPEKERPAEVPVSVEPAVVESVFAEQLEIVPYAAGEVQQRVFDPLAVLLAGRRGSAITEEAPESVENEASSEDRAAPKYLCFRVADEDYAISLMDIREIVKPREVTEVPHAPVFIKGIISLRGMVMPVFDLRLRLGFPETPPTGSERFIIVRKGEGCCGLLVDEVYHVISLKKHPIEKPPAVLEGTDREFVAGIGRHEERVFILMDMEKVLDISLV